MRICFLDFLRPNNALNFIFLLPVFAYFSQVTVVKMQLVWNKAILRRVSTFILLKLVFLDDFLIEELFSGWTFFLNPHRTILRAFLLSKPREK